MEPYQEAAEATKRAPLFNAAKNVAAGAAGAVGFRAANAVISKVAPLLSSFVPESFAKKAIAKIDPRIGQFLNHAEEAGATFDEAKEYISQKLQTPPESEPAKQNGNVIQQYSPHLFTYLKELIAKGKTPVQAAATARQSLEKKHQDIISKMEKDHKTDWSSIVQSIFGGQGMAQQQPQQEQQQQQPGQTQQSGQGSQALMEAVKIAAQARQRRQR